MYKKKVWYNNPSKKEIDGNNRFINRFIYAYL